MRAIQILEAVTLEERVVSIEEEIVHILANEMYLRRIPEFRDMADKSCASCFPPFPASEQLLVKRLKG